VRATPPPVAHSVAAATIPLVVAVLVPLAAASTALAERWLRPVPGEVARPFDFARATPFVAGAHRGADLAAPPGAPVRAACGGRVVHAGPVPGGTDAVSVRCGARRVSYLPLAALAVRAGTAVRAGAPLGTVARGHGGLHVGVRREGDPFGYEDPAALLASPRPPALPLALPRRAPRRTVPARRAPRRLQPRVVERPVAPSPVRGPAGEGVAPWPVWLGLALVLCGAAGTGTVAVRRRRGRRRAGAVAWPLRQG